MRVVADTGDVFSFGSGEYGQLGLADSDIRTEAQQVAALSFHRVVAVGAGMGHSVAITGKVLSVTRVPGTDSCDMQTMGLCLHGAGRRPVSLV